MLRSPAYSSEPYYSISPKAVDIVVLNHELNEENCVFTLILYYGRNGGVFNLPKFGLFSTSSKLQTQTEFRLEKASHVLGC